MTDRYGIIGYPLGHSLSPYMHNRYAYYLGADETYEAFETDPADMEKTLLQMHEDHILGLNVTIPFKTSVIPLLYGIDSGIDRIGAVNTLKYTPEGYIGYNTDVRGLKYTIEKSGLSLKGKDVLILGAGGAARAAAYVSEQSGCSSITVLNRTYEHAESLCRDFKGKPLDYSSLNKLDKTSYIIFQTTSVGMYPYTDVMLPVPDDILSKALSVIDVIYNPGETALIKYVSSLGIPTVNGFDMLINQGLESRKIWKPDEILTKEIKETVYDECTRYSWT